MNKLQYFCQGCENNLDYQLFQIETKPECQQLICSQCNQITCCVQCDNCHQYKFRKQKDVEMILSCQCGSKQRNFKCNNCQQSSMLNNQLLKQSTEIGCGVCWKKLYIVNCPECNKSNMIKSIKEKITCSNCNLKFLIEECQICKQDCFGKGEEQIITFQCANQHVYKTAKCDQCQSNIILQANQQVDNYQCTICNTNQNFIKCQCGYQKMIKSTLQTFRCDKCQLTYKIDKCVRNGCSGLLIDLETLSNTQIQQGVYINISYPICFKCKKQKYKINCLRCQNKKIYENQQDIPSKCPQCVREFHENKSAVCTICESNPIDQVLIPCYHVFACHECSAQFDKCPVCRQQILKKEKIYFSR